MKLNSCAYAEQIAGMKDGDYVEKARQEVAHTLSDSELDHNIRHDKKLFNNEQEKRKSEFEQDLYEIQQLKNVQQNAKRTNLEIEHENERLTIENCSQSSNRGPHFNSWRQ